MKKLLLLIPLLALGACADAGTFTGAVVREAVRGPEYVVVQPRPYYRPYRPYYEPRGWW